MTVVRESRVPAGDPGRRRRPRGLERTEGEVRKRYEADYGVVGGGGEGRLERLILEDSASGHTETAQAAALFALIGAEPRSDWLPEEVERDEKGYVITGTGLLRGRQAPESWPLEQAPLLLETSVPGVFAAGDVRHGATKRVASAVGEGSMVIRLVHGYLEESPVRTSRRQVAGKRDYP